MSSDRSQPSVIFFTGRLLPASETFVRAQAEHLSRFKPYYVGARQVKGLTLPTAQTFVINGGNQWGSL